MFLLDGLFGVGTVVAEPNKNVLIFHSDHHGGTFQDIMVDELEKSLREGDDQTTVYLEYMDVKRFGSEPERVQMLLEQYQFKYHAALPDVVVVVGNFALHFTLSNRPLLFPGVPIVFLGINGFYDTLLEGQQNITGIAESLEYQKIIDLFLSLHPETLQIIGVADSSPTGKIMMRELKKNVKERGGTQEFIAYEGLGMKELQGKLRQHSPDTTILFPLIYSLMPDGRVLSSVESNRFFYNTGIPCYCGYKSYVETGLLGGAVIDGVRDGRLGAEIVFNILHGREADDIPVLRNSPVSYTFDYSQLARFNLKRRDLPAEVDYVNRSGSYLQEIEYGLLAVVASFIVMGLVIYFLVKSVNARKNAERSLKEQENQLKTLLETIPDLVWLKDVEGVYLACNLNFERFFGATQADIVGKNDYDFVDKKLADLFRRKDMVAIETGKTCRNEENVVFAEDGSKVLLETLKTPMFNSKGKIVGVLGVGRDITDRKKMEMRLQQSQKMEAIGTLAGGIAHDFNNILTAIIGFSELAYEEAQSEKTVTECLREVLGASDRAKDLVEQILAFSRQGNSERVCLDMKQVVTKAVSFLRPSLPTTIKIASEIDSSIGMVVGDATQLHQILVNLSTNAFHAMEESGGTLKISLKEVHLLQEDLPHAWDVTAGDYVRLSVVDTGVGVGKELKERIFDPYFTTKEPGKGTGMGLSIVHGIVQNMDGFITVQSRVGKGTRVEVFFPVKGPLEFDEHTLEDPLPLGKERVLFIDDEQMLADLAERMLRKLGYRVTVCTDSVKALHMFQENPDMFDLVITDQTMPVMDGAGLSIKMLQIRPDIPIVLCTGYSSVMSEKRAKDLGVKELVLKPLRTKEVAKIMRKVLDEHSCNNVPVTIE